MPFRTGTFFLEVLDGEFRGYTNDHSWNGWATPYFELEVAQKVARLSNQLDDDVHIFFDEDSNVSFMEEGAYPDASPTPLRPLSISVQGKSETVYPMGTCYWTWQEKLAHPPTGNS